MKTMIINGHKGAEPLVRVTYMVLSDLFTKLPLAAYDLVMVARDPGYVCFGSIGDELEARNLLGPPDNKGVREMHESLRNIIKASVEGDGLEMRLRRPDGLEATR